MKKSIFCLIYLFVSSYVLSQNLSKEISFDNYVINLSWSDSLFFSGKISIINKSEGKTIFEADSVYSRFNWDTLIDLNEDANKELILDLATGALMYDYNMYLIFDFAKNPVPVFEVHNADLITNVDNVPKIMSHIRLSPSYLGAGFSFPLKYNGKSLVLETDPGESKVLRELKPVEKDEALLIGDFKKETDECEEGSSFRTYFEAYITQMRIVNHEKDGWKFFDKYYNCKNKQTVRKELIKIVNENYDYIKNETFKFNN